MRWRIERMSNLCGKFGGLPKQSITSKTACPRFESLYPCHVAADFAAIKKVAFCDLFSSAPSLLLFAKKHASIGYSVVNALNNAFGLLPLFLQFLALGLSRFYVFTFIFKNHSKMQIDAHFEHQFFVWRVPFSNIPSSTASKKHQFGKKNRLFGRYSTYQIRLLYHLILMYLS